MPTVTYVILTCEAYQTTRCAWIRSTWLRDVKSYVFLSSAPSGSDVVGWTTSDDYASCPVKYIEFFKHATPDTDWIVFVDDDTFVFPQRLEGYLATLDATSPLYVGYTLDHEPSGPFMSGGAGFAMTRSLYRQVQAHVQSHTVDELVVHIGSDVCIARWMQSPIFHDVRAMNPNLNHVDAASCLTVHPCTQELFQTYAKVLRGDDIPVFILAYNNPTHVKSMVEQVRRLTDTYYVVDNASTFQPMKDYLATIDSHVIRMEKNYGHSVYYQPQVWSRAGEKFILTDPDLLLNADMPTNVIQVLSTLSDRYRVNKVGLALDITGPIRSDFRLKTGETIVEWESQFWTKRVPHETYELYEAALDTTFCLFNKRVPGYSALRIAGPFTCVHRPWYTGWEADLLPGELEAYRSGNVSSHYTVDSGSDYGRSDLDQAIQWHPECRLARQLRAAFYHLLHLELASPRATYLTTGSGRYSLPLLKTQELLVWAGERATHALLDGVHTGCAAFLLLLSNPSLTIDCLCDEVPPSLSYLNAQFGGRISIGRTRDSYDLLHVDAPDPVARVQAHSSSLTPTAWVVIANPRPECQTLTADHRRIWVASAQGALLVRNRCDPPYTPESTPPSDTSN